MNKIWILLGFALLLISVTKAQTLEVMEPKSKELKVLVEEDQNITKTILIKNTGKNALFDLNAFLQPDINGINAGLLKTVLDGEKETSAFITINASELNEGITKTFLVIQSEGKEEARIKVEVEKTEKKISLLQQIKQTPIFIYFMLVLGITVFASGALDAFDSTNQNLAFIVIGLMTSALSLLILII